MMDRDFVRAALAEACARHFFETFDGNLGNLRDLYHEDAWMTFVGEKYQGRPAISAKFESLGLQHSQHSITSVDSHPMREDGAMFVQVLGHWNFTEAGGHQQIRNFCEGFYLLPTPEGGYCIMNDIFRLVSPVPPENYYMITD